MSQFAKIFRHRKIVELYLRAWNIQESIAKILGVPQQTIADVIKNTEKRQMSDFGKTFQPILYNIWQKLKQDVDITNKEISKKY